MDLRHVEAVPTSEELAAIDQVLGASAPPEGAVAQDTVPASEAAGRRHLLLPVLHAVQSRVGWISAGALGEACRRLHVPPAEAYGVATFYALFATSPRAPIVVHACDDIACKAHGADELCRRLEATVGPTGADSRATWMRSPCLGLCEQAPAALLVAAGQEPIERAWGHVTAESVVAAIAVVRTQRDAAQQDGGERTAAPSSGPTGLDEDFPVRPRTIPLQPREDLRLLARIGLVDPTSIDDYRAHGGYEALRLALEMGPAGVLREVTESKLQGRGGAAFPTGRKWAAVAAQPVRPHYLVCNADESEPGTFKDRVLMEEDPCAVVEAMTIAGLATGCEKGYLYVRGEYPLATERMQGAIDQARARGLLGRDILGRRSGTGGPAAHDGATFDIEIRRGAGAYICGEETALFNSIEGFRGEPRNKPPFPVEVGLFRRPTVVNNVETLVNVLDVVREGGVAFAARGTGQSTGTKLFCLCGHVERPGLYEVVLGTRLDQLLAMAGGVRGRMRPGAVLLGGAAGTFLRPDELSVPLTFEDTRKIGATLGSGVVFVLEEGTDVLPYLRRLAEFFRDESCGQCVPCRVGTVRQEELLARLEHGRPLGSIAQERLLLKDLGTCMRDASICGLGQTASAAIESAVDKLGILGEGAP